MSDTFVLWGVKFSTAEWGSLVGNFLILIGIALTLYIVLFFGNEDKHAGPASTSTSASKSPASARKRNNSGTE
jgi:hypothetical protein